MPGVLSVDLACAAANIGLCVLQSEKGDVWRAHFIPSPNWNLPTPLIPTTLADVIYDFCVREHISIVLLDGPQGWKDPESSLPHCRECERVSGHEPGQTESWGALRFDQ